MKRKKPKDKRCKECKQLFTQTYSTTQVVCSALCGSKQAKKVTEKAINKKATERRKETLEMKKAAKGLPEYKKDLERQINTIIRLIDAGNGCVSCGGHTTPQAGHYHSVNANGTIRYHLDNIHLQDYNCNCERGGNLHKYDIGLINRYGETYWNYVKFGLTARYPTIKLQVFEIKEAITVASAIVKELKKENKIYNSEERLKLRAKYNRTINLYL